MNFGLPHHFISTLTALPMSKVDHSLQQREEITNYLQTLVQAHERALSDDRDGGDLYQIRESISICFDDLIQINDTLTSHNGILREEVERIKGARLEILDLSTKQIGLIRSREEWSTSDKMNKFRSDITPRSGNDGTVDNITIPLHYCGPMNKYIELVGASNTTLASQHDLQIGDLGKLDELTDERSPTDKSTMFSSLEYLQQAQLTSDSDIKSLEATLESLKRDQSFIERELKRQIVLIQSTKDSISSDLEIVTATKRDLFQKLEIPMPSTEPSESVAKRLLNMVIKDESAEQQIQDVNDELSLAIEYIDMKVTALADQLKEFKDESSELLTQKELWAQCTHEVLSLEDDLKIKFSEHMGKPHSSELIINTIQSTIDNLEDIQKRCSTNVLSSLTGNEIATLKKACSILSEEVEGSMSSSVKTEGLSPLGSLGDKNNTVRVALSDSGPDRSLQVDSLFLKTAHQPRNHVSSSLNEINRTAFRQKATRDKSD